MKITYPYTIENGLGEKIIFHSVQKERGGDRVIVENFVTTAHGIPTFIKKTIMPMTCIVGRMLGKYKKFEDAPEPVVK